MKQKIKLSENWQLLSTDGDDCLNIYRIPMGVHEILYEHKKIGNDFQIGIADDFLWVSEQDWIYTCRFQADFPKAFLYFEMLDTLAAIYLNGVEIAQSKDMYLPLRVDVSGKLLPENELTIHFSSPQKWLQEQQIPEKWQGKFPLHKLLRKPITDFTHYLGACPYLTTIGIFGDVVLEVADHAEIISCDTEAILQDDLQTGEVRLYTEIRVDSEHAENMYIQVKLFSPNGGQIKNKIYEFPEGECEISATIPLDCPELWWPRGYGKQNLYLVSLELLQKKDSHPSPDDKILDSCEKYIGFRTLKTGLDFDLHVNHVKIRMWGSNLAPLDGRTHTWNPARAKKILDLAEMANMNTLRIWGEGEPFHDELYLECDRRGILLWQEFYGSYGMHPDSSEYKDLLVREAVYQIQRLKHHPSIFMWCGGNEIIMGAEYDHDGEEMVGLEIFTKIYPELCTRLDPSRYYQPTSPYGGEWANDPRTGDTHGYEMWWHVPGMEYPVAFSEHMRVSGPAVKSMRKWIPNDKAFWPENFTDVYYPGDHEENMMPESWFKRVGNSLDVKSGPIHEFRDADTPEELAYKYAAAHAKSFKDGIKRSRMGRPSGSTVPRISNMHLIWKFADTFPLIYSAIVDYYLEPYIPYYEAKRSYEPVMCCFDVRDSINLWLVNDSANATSGTLEYGLFSISQNKFTRRNQIQTALPAGESKEIVNLDSWGQFRTDHILFARYTDHGNGLNYINFDYVDIERRLHFPDAKLSLEIDCDGSIVIYSDSFARCVELSGDDRGDAFGFYFSDNYFDLIPGMKKKIQILGEHKNGMITAKAHYAEQCSSISWEMKS